MHYLDYAAGQGYMSLSLIELESLPTLSVGQTADLKIDQNNERVWLERTGIADGEPFDNKVTVEFLIDGNWILVAEYEAK